MVQVIGTLAHLAAADGLEIVDISAAKKPKLLGRYTDFRGIGYVHVAGNRAYIPEWVNETDVLRVLDVSDPTSPKLIDTNTTIYDSMVQVVDHLVYAIGGNVVQILHVRDPANPQVIASYDTSELVSDVQAVGNLIYVANRQSGLQILRFHSDLFPATITIDAGGGNLESFDGGARLQFASGAVRSSTAITFVDTMTATHALSADSQAIRTFTLQARDPGGQPVTRFEKPYTLALNYTDEQLAALGIDEQALNLAYWNGSAWVNVLPCAGCGVERVNNRLTAVLGHFSEFALLGGISGDERFQEYLAVVRT
jgi:hypothetical protein